MLRGVSRTQRTRARFSFRRDVGGSFDKAGGDSVGNAGQGANAAWDDDHRVCGIRAAGHIGADIAIGLLLDFLRLAAQKLRDEPGTALHIEFFGQDAKAALGSDEVDGLNSIVTFEQEQ